jgi:predicted RNase H-like HicB family nuclease
MTHAAETGMAGSMATNGSALSMREWLSIPYRIEACTTQGPDGAWLRRATYPELPGCMAEAATIEDALRRLERRRIEIIVAMVRAGRRPPLPRPPLCDGDPEGQAREVGLTGLLTGTPDDPTSSIP